MQVQGKEKIYEVVWDEKQGRFICTCPHYTYRLSAQENGECKHIIKARGQGLREGKKPVKHSYLEAEDMFNKWYDILREFTGNNMLRFCGSFRRHKKWVKDHDIVIYIPKHIARNFLLRAIKDNGGVVGISGDKKIVFDDSGFSHDIRIVRDSRHFIPHVLHCTGSKEENIRLRKIASDQCMSISEWGVEESDGTMWYPETEQALYEKLNIPYVMPELR